MQKLVRTYDARHSYGRNNPQIAGKTFIKMLVRIWTSVAIDCSRNSRSGPRIPTTSGPNEPVTIVPLSADCMARASSGPAHRGFRPASPAARPCEPCNPRD